MRAMRAKAAAVGVAAGLLFVAGCGQGGDGADVEAGQPAGFAATKDYLVGLVDDTADEAFRFEMAMDIEGLPSGMEMPSMTGEQDGELMSMTMDMSAMAEGEDLPPGLDEDDLVMEMAGDATTMYMRAPFLGALADESEVARQPEWMRQFVEGLAQGWVSIDLSALGDLGRGQAAGAVGGSGMDPQMMLDLVRAADSVTELGEDVVRGVPVTGLGAEMTLADMIGAQGGDPAAVPRQMADIVVAMEVWVDSDGLIRRVDLGYELDGELLGAGAPSSIGFGFTLDFFDYGDDSIEVELPADAVDVTDAFRQLLESQGNAANKLPGGLDVSGGASAAPTVNLPEMPAVPEMPAYEDIPEVEVPPELTEPVETLPPYEPPEIPEMPEIPPELTTVPTWTDPCTTTDVC